MEDESATPVLQTRPQVALTWACLAALVAFLGVVALMTHLQPATAKVGNAGAYLRHTMGRDLLVEEALAAEDTGIGALYRSFLASTQPGGLDAVAAAFEGIVDPARGVPSRKSQDPTRALQVMAEGVHYWDDADTLAMLAVVQFERGNSDRGKQLVARLKELGDHLTSFRVAQAYGVPMSHLGGGVFRELDPLWLESTLSQRQDELFDHPPGADEERRRRIAAGQRGAWTMILLDGGSTVLCLLGLLLLPLYLWKRPDLTIARGMSQPPWSASEGFGVIARAALIGMVAGQCLCPLTLLPLGTIGFPIGSLMMGLPAVALGIHYLHGPYRQRFSEAFGLTHVRLGRLALVTLGCLSLTLALQTGVMWMAVALGLGPHWSESVIPGLILGSNLDAANMAFTVAISAPVGEELLFRAYLYSALRTRYSARWSIVVSALVFGLVHPYSVAGLVAVASSGLVWAWSYEKTRSLWPALLCHALMNGTIAALQLGLYR